MRLNLSPLTKIINAVGNFELDGSNYYCRVPVENVVLPYNITFHNLRNTVQALANPATPQEVRLFFYNNCPLPGARWGPHPRGQGRNAPFDLNVELQNNPQWPLLTNPEEFWPDDYDQNDFEDDLSRVQALPNFCSRKSIKYFSAGVSINYDSPGVETALVSNYCQELRNPSLRYNAQGEVDWAGCSMTQGTLSE